VRVWHPGQQWIWRPGGLGVFDPGINALSILTHILPARLAVLDAELNFPSNCETPIAARVSLGDSLGASVEIELDFRQRGPQIWEIVVEANEETLCLSMGGQSLNIGGVPAVTVEAPEYRALYMQFAQLVHAGRCDVDIAPLQLAADAFLCGRRIVEAPFIDGKPPDGA
jgi:D-galactose 1-dehydrogenase